jgi:putative oxidoreductase
MSAIRRLMATDDGFVGLVLRFVLGIVMFPHGAQEVMGWFGGYGYAGTMQFFTQQMHIPPVFAILAIAAEFAGAIALILGLGTRIAALGIAVNMAVATYLVHLPNGFFMNWYGNQKGEGYEYHILAAGIALVLVAIGGGRGSLDNALSSNEV